MWSVYQTILTTAVPFVLEIILYTVMSCKKPYNNIAAIDKHIRGDDIRALRFFRSSSVVCFLLTSSYFAIIIINLNGVYIQPIVIFLTSLLYFASSVSLLVAWFVVECDPFACITSVLRNCWNVSRRKFSSECAEISIGRSTLSRMKQRSFPEPKTYLWTHISLFCFCIFLNFIFYIPPPNLRCKMHCNVFAILKNYFILYESTFSYPIESEAKVR